VPTRRCCQYVGLSLAKEMILTGDLYPVAGSPRAGCAMRWSSPASWTRRSTLADRVAGHTRTATAAQKRLFEVWQTPR